MRIILSILVSLIVSSCATDIFMLNLKEQSFTEAYLMSGWGTITKLNDNSLQLESRSLVSIRKKGYTEYEAKFNLQKNSETIVNLYLRTTRNNFTNDSSIRIEISKNIVNVYENTLKIKELQIIQTSSDNMQLIKIINEGKKLKFSIDCDEILIENCSLKNTEFIVIETLATTRTIVSGITIDSLKFD